MVRAARWSRTKPPFVLFPWLRGWGLPLGWLTGWGWAQVRSLLPFSIFPVSITACPGPLPVLPSMRGVLTLRVGGAPGLGHWASPVVGRGAVSLPAPEAFKQMQD